MTANTPAPSELAASMRERALDLEAAVSVARDVHEDAPGELEWVAERVQELRTAADYLDALTTAQSRIDQLTREKEEAVGVLIAIRDSDYVNRQAMLLRDKAQIALAKLSAENPDQ